MKIKFLGSTMLAIFGWQTASAVEVSWYRQPGSAISVASNASASVWMIGTDNNVYKFDYNLKQFANQNFSATRIGITTADKFWLVDQYGLRSADPPLYLSMKAREVAVGADNSAWIIGTDARAGGYGVYQATGLNSFTYANFAAVRIAVDKAGNAWVVNDTGEVYMYNIASKSWERKGTAKARSVHTGASSGAVWMLGRDSIPGGFPIYQWNSTKQDWETYGTYGAVEMTEAAGVPWIVQSDGRLYSKIALATTTLPTTVGSITWPTPTPQAGPPLNTEKGKLLCTSDAFKTCGDTRADWVGKHELDTSCDSGFYDPIWGGTCWKCPDNDGRGAWIRSLDPVNEDTACWRRREGGNRLCNQGEGACALLMGLSFRFVLG